jgi:hypothetical protein
MEQNSKFFSFKSTEKLLGFLVEEDDVIFARKTRKNAVKLQKS